MFERIKPLPPSSRRIVMSHALSWMGVAMALPGVAQASAGPRTLKFENLHTGDRLKATYFADGAYVGDALAEIAWVLRDHRTDTTHPIDARLLDLLARLNQTLDVASPYQIISGYRAPQSNAKLASASSGVAKKSLHLDGWAVDIRVPGVALGTLRDAALSLRQGGVGFYPESNFVHVDIGRVRRW